MGLVDRRLDYLRDRVQELHLILSGCTNEELKQDIPGLRKRLFMIYEGYRFFKNMVHLQFDRGPNEN